MEEKALKTLDQTYNEYCNILDTEGVQEFVYIVIDKTWDKIKHTSPSTSIGNITLQILMDLHDCGLLSEGDTFFTQKDLMYDLDTYFKDALIPPVYVETLLDNRAAVIRSDNGDVDDNIPIKLGTLKSTFVDYIQTHEKALLSKVSKNASDDDLAKSIINYVEISAKDSYIIKKVGKDRLKEILSNHMDEVPWYLGQTLWPDDDRFVLTFDEEDILPFN